MRNLAAPLLVLQGLWCMIFCDIEDPLTSEIEIHIRDLPIRTRSSRSLSGYCADEWRPFGDNCYKEFGLAQNDAKIWIDAATHCQSIGADLTSVHSEEEQGFLNSFAFDKSTKIWIGLRRSACYSYNWCRLVGFQWKDNSPTNYLNWMFDVSSYGEENHEYTWLGREILRYTNWMPGQPTDESDKENCVAIDKSGQWVVRDCSEKRPFICEVREGVPTIAPPHPNMTCPKTSSKWNDFGGNYCYIVETSQEFTKTEALKLCCHEGGSLASIHSIDEINAILHYTGYHGELYIGFERNQNGDFLWDDGSTIDFVNWDSDEPNSRAEKCTEMHASGRWNDILCTEKFGYVCSTPKVPNTEDPVKVGYVSQVCSSTIALIIIICLILLAVTAGLIYYYFYLSERRKESDEVLLEHVSQ